MSTRLIVAVALVFGWAAPAPAADIADHFPANALVYAELTRPAELAIELKALSKGSILEDILPHLNKIRERQHPNYYNEILYHESDFLTTVGTLLGPEMLIEAKRFEGAAVALVGFTSNRRPEYVALLRSGDSQMPGMLMRKFLAADNMMRVAGQVEGVSVYQYQNQNPYFVNFNGEPQKQEPIKPQAGVPTYAYLPGSLLAGSSYDAVAQVVRRLKGTEKTPALSSLPAFKEAAAALRDRPGAFVFADPKGLIAKVEALYKGDDEMEPFELALARELANPKAVRSVAVSLSPRPEHFDLRVVVDVEPKQACPLLDVLTEQKATLAQLPGLPRDAWLSLAVALPAGEDRWQKLVALADAAAKARGGLGMTPGEAVRALEERTKRKVGPEVLGKVTGVTLALPAKPELPEGAVPLPMVVFTTTDPVIAEELENLVPELAGLFGGEKVELVTETVKGQKVRSMAGGGLPWASALHVARRGSRVVVGQDRQAVAAAAGDAARLLADANLAGLAKSHESAAAVGAWQWGPVFKQLATTAAADRKKIMAQYQQQMGIVEDVINLNVNAQFVGPPAPDEKKKEKPEDPVEKQYKELAAAMEKVPPVVVALSRQGGRMVVEARQPRAGEGSARLIDGLVQWSAGVVAIRSSSMNGMMFPGGMFGFGGIAFGGFFGGGGLIAGPGGEPAPEDRDNNTVVDPDKPAEEKKEGEKPAEEKKDKPAEPEKKDPGEKPAPPEEKK